MATSYDKRPQVLVVSPRNYATEVLTTLKQITVGFNTDLDVNHIAGNFRLQDKNGKYIRTQAEYENRTVTLTILEELSPGTTYQVVVIGDSDLKDTVATGVRNVFGLSMAGIYESTFTTVSHATLPAPTVIFPMNQVVIKEKPGFSWERVEGALQYQIQLGKGADLVPVIWPADPDSNFFNTLGPVVPNIPMSDGNYYWRIRAVDGDGRFGDWSSVLTFNLDTQQEGTVSDEDTIPPEEGVQYDPFLAGLESEIIETFPKELESNIKTTLKTIYFRVLGTVTEADISFEMFGESVTGEGVDHGKVTGQLTVTPQDDGTTIIAFTPSVLSS